MKRSRKYFMGVDLGQANDYTAVSVIERVERREDGETRSRYHLGHLERFPLGTSYPGQVERVGELIAALKGSPFRHEGRVTWDGDVRLVVDATGVGRPVVDLLRAARLRPEPVTITGGDAATSVDGFHRVPKRDLVSSLQVALQKGTLRVQSGLELAPVLRDEMLAFRVKLNARGHDTYGNDWRENPHDDLVLATALALYWPESRNTSDLAALRRAVGWAG